MRVDNAIPVPADDAMTLRDYFAAAAITGHADRQGHSPELVKDAFLLADEMLTERAK